MLLVVFYASLTVGIFGILKYFWIIKLNLRLHIFGGRINVFKKETEPSADSGLDLQHCPDTDVSSPLVANSFFCS